MEYGDPEITNIAKFSFLKDMWSGSTDFRLFTYERLWKSFKGLSLDLCLIGGGMDQYSFERVVLS